MPTLLEPDILGEAVSTAPVAGETAEVVVGGTDGTAGTAAPGTETNEKVREPKRRWTLGDRWIPSSYMVPLRFIIGFQFLAAWFRRYVNEPSKMDPKSSSNMAHKLSTMIPHAMPPIRQLLNALVMHPNTTWHFLIIFSFIEFAVGLCLMTGTLTRIAALGAALLSFGMLFGNGWLGTACVDEFQIGSVEGIAAMVLMFTGAGTFGVDVWLHRYWDGHLHIGKLDLHLA